MNDNAEMAAYAYLLRVVEPPTEPPLATRQLVQEVGAIQAARLIQARQVSPELGDETAVRWESAVGAAKADLVRIDQGEARLIWPGHDEWPNTVSQLGPMAPLALWARGKASLRERSEQAVSITGARAPTSYGEHAATNFAYELSSRDVTVVSGGAYGIDTAAHRGSLAAAHRGVLAVAVLGCGVDIDYPYGNMHLFAEILDRDGLIVSEYPPGTHPARHRILARNRLVAALSCAIIVVEAGLRSGALNAARWARNLDQPVLAVPGAITSSMSAGTNAMLRSGEAIAVTTADEVMQSAGLQSSSASS